jgi:hypothetical protein
LTRLSALTKAARARLYVLGYLDARGDLGNASAALEGAASRLGIPFVDLRSVAREAEVAGPREEYLQHDGHPRPLGYGMEALELARVLREREGLGGSAPEGAVAWYRRVRLDSTAGRPAMGAELERADSEGGVILIVKTEPMRTGWLIVGRESAAKPLGTLDVPIDFEDAARIGAQTRLTFDTDATGVARVKLPREVLAWTEERLYAAAVLHAMPDASSALVHSKVMDVKTGAAATRQIRSR